MWPIFSLSSATFCRFCVDVRHGSVLVLSLLGIPDPAWAEAGNPERKEVESDYVESITFEEVLPNDAGEWDVRVSVEAARSTSEEGPPATVLMLPRGQIFFGIVDRLGGEVDVPLLLRVGRDRAAGLGDAGVGLKFLAFRQSGLFPSLTGMFEARVPTGDPSRHLGEGRTELETSIGWATVFPILTIQGVIGHSVTLPDREHELNYALSIGLLFLERFHLFGEILGQTGIPEPRSDLSAGPGVKYDVTREFFLAAGVVVGLTGAAEPYRAVVQVQHGF